jgi:glycosyltransferase involved in cell wall biosynthesis
MKLVWNAIVKNERAVIERCVKSLLPHIDGAVVVDTGSIDGTPDKLKELFEAAGKPLEITPAPFKNFEQARNEALRCARLSRMEWDYLLLADADMELRVTRQPWLNGEKGPSYDVRQVAGTLGYFNRRLLSRHATGWYVGVTHEYLDVASAGHLDGAEFIDHADGSNRPEKLSRDIALLEEALQSETRAGLIERYNFYLAGSYYDVANWSKAAEHYAKRVALGGFAEEQWYSQMRLGMCRKQMGDLPGFLSNMLAAYRMRPQRAEVLYELARYYREQGDNFTSLLFSEAGLQVPHAKTDLLFVNDWAYKSGIKEEFAICAYYDERKRAAGAKMCNELALAGSDQARNNLFWYLKPLREHVPSFTPAQIKFEPPEGYVATNPSVVNRHGLPRVLVRAVNYTITPEGQYVIKGTDGTCNNSNPINTRNYVLRIRDDVLEPYEIALPSLWPEPLYPLVRGFEDSRLFEWNDQLWTLSTVRELTPDGWCEQVLAPIDVEQGPYIKLRYGDNYRRILPKVRQHEKNWMPWVKDNGITFVYRLGTLINTHGEIVRNHDVDFDVSNISGGSQVIEVMGNYIAVVHEARLIPGRPYNRFYQHRFVRFSDAGEVMEISPAFYLHDRQIEFVAGLAYFPDKKQLMMSYGVRDCEAWTATMDPDEVLNFIESGT